MAELLGIVWMRTIFFPFSSNLLVSIRVRSEPVPTWIVSINKMKMKKVYGFIGYLCFDQLIPFQCCSGCNGPAIGSWLLKQSSFEPSWMQGLLTYLERCVQFEWNGWWLECWGCVERDLTTSTTRLFILCGGPQTTGYLRITNISKQI